MQSTNSAIPIFEPVEAGTEKRPRRVHAVKIAGTVVPATEEEVAALKARLETHIEKSGVKYGFFASLLGEAADFVLA